MSGLGSGVALAGLLVFVLGPLYWIAVTAFKSEGQVVMRDHDLWPTPWTLEQFGALFTNQPFGRWYLNTVLVSAASTAVALVCAALAGYALARLRFRGAQGFTVTVLLTYVMPGALLFIPLYQLLIGVRLTDSLWSLVVTYPTFTLPFATWLLAGYFASIPVELEEAALVDGCTRFQAFRRVVLPLAKPGLLAVALFTLTNAWNEFLFAFVFITKDEYKTLPVGMQSMIAGDVVPQGQLAAASLLVSIPVVVMYAFGQRFLTEGLTAGAVKGSTSAPDTAKVSAVGSDRNCHIDYPAGSHSTRKVGLPNAAESGSTTLLYLVVRARPARISEQRELLWVPLRTGPTRPRTESFRSNSCSFRSTLRSLVIDHFGRTRPGCGEPGLDRRRGHTNGACAEDSGPASACAGGSCVRFPWWSVAGACEHHCTRNRKDTWMMARKLVAASLVLATGVLGIAACGSGDSGQGGAGRQGHDDLLAQRHDG